MQANNSTAAPIPTLLLAASLPAKAAPEAQVDRRPILDAEGGVVSVPFPTQVLNDAGASRSVFLAWNAINKETFGTGEIEERLLKYIAEAQPETHDNLLDTLFQFGSSLKGMKNKLLIVRLINFLRDRKLQDVTLPAQSN
jgi:hypothetical protein